MSNQLFESPVPAEVLKAMNKAAGSSAPNWREAFGDEAEVCFHAWAVAKYVGQIAAAGKAAYPLRFYVNAALRDPLKPGGPGSYESGGPTDNVIPIWKAEAPAIDILAPDNYTNELGGLHEGSGSLSSSRQCLVSAGDGAFRFTSTVGAKNAIFHKKLFFKA